MDKGHSTPNRPRASTERPQRGAAGREASRGESLPAAQSGGKQRTAARPATSVGGEATKGAAEPPLPPTEPDRRGKKRRGEARWPQTKRHARREEGRTPARGGERKRPAPDRGRGGDYPANRSLPPARGSPLPRRESRRPRRGATPASPPEWGKKGERQATAKPKPPPPPNTNRPTQDHRKRQGAGKGAHRGAEPGAGAPRRREPGGGSIDVCPAAERRKRGKQAGRKAGARPPASPGIKPRLSAGLGEPEGSSRTHQKRSADHRQRAAGTCPTEPRRQSEATRRTARGQRPPTMTPKGRRAKRAGAKPGGTPLLDNRTLFRHTGGNVLLRNHAAGSRRNP